MAPETNTGKVCIENASDLYITWWYIAKHFQYVYIYIYIYIYIYTRQCINVKEIVLCVLYTGARTRSVVVVQVTIDTHILNTLLQSSNSARSPTPSNYLLHLSQN